MKLSRLTHIVVGGDVVSVHLFLLLSLLLVDLEQHMVLHGSNYKEEVIKVQTCRWS